MAAATKTEGFNNGNSNLTAELYVRYVSGDQNPDGGSMEIVTYNKFNGYSYTVSGMKGAIVASKIDTVANEEGVKDITGTDYDVKTLTNINDDYGDITSVSVSPDGKKLAAAIQHKEYDSNGWVVIFTCNMDGTLSFESLKDAGVQPDMVEFASNDVVLSANEGEPRNGYETPNVNPKGSVSVINIKDNTETNVGFDSYTSAELTEKNVLLGKVGGVTNAPAVDLEPEYIAVSKDGTKAYVSLQEANAIAVLDIATKSYTGIYSCGFVDFSQATVDIQDDGKYESKRYDGLLGARMPDGISTYEANGKTYVLTANEGDAREWGSYTNEEKKAGIADNKIRVINSELCDGLPSGVNVMFGGRSFTMYEATENGLKQVFDSGNDFEVKTAQYIPSYFNCSNDDIVVDSRSQKKGPEAETVTVGKVGDKTYAFIGLERIGGVMIYDITDTLKPVFVNYINSRDFSADIAGDVAPEGLKFIETNKSGNGVLLAACEVSGTLAAYELKDKNQSVIEPTTASTATTAFTTATRPSTVATKKIKVTGASKRIAYGKGIQLKASVSPSNATNKGVKWTSSNKKYATVSSKGYVKTKKAGRGKTVKITVISKANSKIKTTYKLTIAKGAVKKIQITGAKTKSVKVGKSIKLKTEIATSKGAYKSVTWKVSNKKYASVTSNGKVIVKKAGKGKTITVTVTAKDGTKKKATVKIRIR